MRMYCFGQNVYISTVCCKPLRCCIREKDIFYGFMGYAEEKDITLIVVVYLVIHPWVCHIL